MNNINLPRIFVFILFTIISFFLVSKFEKYFFQKDHAKIFFLTILFILFFLGLIIKNFTKKSLILFFYFFLVLYSVNLLLVVYNYNNRAAKKIERALASQNKAYDKRTLLEFVEYKKKSGKKIYPHVVPREFLEKNQGKNFYLTAMPNTNYVSCNEFGEWKQFRTDDLGFNNEKFIKNFEILLVGDSFAEGSCVNKLSEPSNLFSKNYNLLTYSIGVSGNGPLLSLALIHEMQNKVNFNHIVWLIYDNDFYDLKVEKKHSFLNNYLKNDFLKNNYFEDIDRIKKEQIEYINSKLSNYKKKYSLKENILELKELIFFLNTLHQSEKTSKYYSNDFKDDFKKVFSKLEKLYPNKKITVVYLPETTCFTSRGKDCTLRFELLSSTSKKIKFLNFYDHIKSNFKNFKEIYALGMDRAHFSEKGYRELVKFIHGKF